MEESVVPWTIERTEVFEIAGPFGLQFEVSVGLPEHHVEGKKYRVLVALDAPATFPLALASARAQSFIGATDEIIVVGVSTPRRLGRSMVGLQRLKYLTPGAPPEHDASVQAVLKLFAEQLQQMNWSYSDCFGGASEFLGFLRADLLPLLAARYPVDNTRYGILGHSAAGAFVAYALLHEQTPFERYIAGTFATQWFDDLPALEARFAHRARTAKIAAFHGVGGGELSDPALAGARTGLELMNRLGAINAADLSVETRVYEGENHASVAAHVIASGIRSLYATGRGFEAGLAARQKSR